VQVKDLQNSKLIWLKAILFLVIGFTSAALLWLDTPTIKNSFLLVLTVWAFCRSYYFAFYALERYVDPRFKFAGLGSLGRYVFASSKWRSKIKDRADRTYEQTMWNPADRPTKPLTGSDPIGDTHADND